MVNSKRPILFSSLFILVIILMSGMVQAQAVTTVEMSTTSQTAKAYMESYITLTVTDVEGRDVDVFFQDVSDIGFVFAGNPSSFEDVASGRTLLQTVEVPPAAYPGQHVIRVGAIPSLVPSLCPIGAR